LKPYVNSLVKEDHLKRLLTIISETLLDITEDLESTNFCVVCHKDHGKLKLRYLSAELESENPDIVKTIIQMHSGNEKENGGMDMMDTKQSSSTSSMDGSP